MNKTTRKMFRLQTREKYIIKKVCDYFEIETKDLKLKSFVGIQGFSIVASEQIYNKADFYRLNNFSKMIHCFLVNGSL